MGEKEIFCDVMKQQKIDYFEEVLLADLDIEKLDAKTLSRSLDEKLRLQEEKYANHLAEIHKKPQETRQQKRERRRQKIRETFEELKAKAPEMGEDAVKKVLRRTFKSEITKILKEVPFVSELYNAGETLVDNRFQKRGLLLATRGLVSEFVSRAPFVGRAASHLVEQIPLVKEDKILSSKEVVTDAAKNLIKGVGKDIPVLDNIVEGGHLVVKYDGKKKGWKLASQEIVAGVAEEIPLLGGLASDQIRRIKWFKEHKERANSSFSIGLDQISSSYSHKDLEKLCSQKELWNQGKKCDAAEYSRASQVTGISEKVIAYAYEINRRKFPKNENESFLVKNCSELSDLEVAAHVASVFSQYDVEKGRFFELRNQPKDIKINLKPDDSKNSSPSHTPKKEEFPTHYAQSIRQLRGLESGVERSVRKTTLNTNLMSKKIVKEYS